MKEAPKYTVERDPVALTTAELCGLVIAEKGWDPSSGSARNFKSQANQWCELAGATLDSPSCYRLYRDNFSRLLAEATSSIEEKLGQNGKPRSAKNVRSVAQQLKEAYDEILKQAGPVGTFKEALNTAMNLRGLTIEQLCKLVTAQTKVYWHPKSIKKWASGQYMPMAGSKPIVDIIEKLLELPPGSLAIFGRKPKVIAPLLSSRVIPFRVHAAKLARTPYALKPFPKRIEDIHSLYVAWKFDHVVLIDGERTTVEEEFRWSSQESVSFYEESVQRYLGFLCLPVPAVPLHKLKDEDKWLAGKGMKPEDLRFHHLLNTTLLWEYLEFLRSRQVNKQFSRTGYDLARMLCAMVATKRSFVRNNYALLKDEFEEHVGPEKWTEHCNKIHDKLKAVMKELRKGGAFKKQRDPEVALKDLWTQEEPLQVLLTLIEMMENDLPPDTRPMSMAVAKRDICLFKMQYEVPLRLKNFNDLRVGQHLIWDARVGLWRVSVPLKELKNHHSPHAEDIDRYYSAATSKWMSDYFDNHRQYLLGATTTTKFFLAMKNCGKGDAINNPKPAQGIVERVTKKYLGMTSGMNFFRHLAATSILKEDSSQIDAAAAVLNNSPDMVRENYGHLQQKDGLRHAGSFFDRQVSKHKGKGATGNG